ncbi:MAG: hypothetical protein NTW50_00695 [Candidatus Berkelbacteria bacterium]|nr:hypothetical protein [Candidatus Berkelbacteria bacterium]
MSWIVAILLLGMGLFVGGDVLYILAPSLKVYSIIGKILDIGLYLAPALILHASLIIRGRRYNVSSLIIVYIISFVMYILDVASVTTGNGLQLRQGMNIATPNNFIFIPGTLLLPVVAVEVIICLFAAYNFSTIARSMDSVYFFAVVGAILLSLSGIFMGFAYYWDILSASTYFNVLVSLAMAFIIYSMIKFQAFSDKTQKIFDKLFYIKTTAISILALLYFAIIWLCGLPHIFSLYLCLLLVLLLVLLTHSFYDWLSTFINDLVFNATSGLSLVNDEEVSQALKYYNKPERIEESTMFRLSIITKKMKQDNITPVDALRSVIREATEYFKPIESENLRLKQNLKYRFLKMMTFEGAEEGQILWELGFEEYPVSIMTRETKSHPPKFRASSPAEYSAVSRNAFMALKKEAVHDVTWRISYLEKISRNK